MLPVRFLVRTRTSLGELLKQSLHAVTCAQRQDIETAIYMTPNLDFLRAIFNLEGGHPPPAPPLSPGAQPAPSPTSADAYTRARATPPLPARSGTPTGIHPPPFSLGTPGLSPGGVPHALAMSGFGVTVPGRTTPTLAPAAAAYYPPPGFVMPGLPPTVMAAAAAAAAAATGGAAPGTPGAPPRSPATLHSPASMMAAPMRTSVPPPPGLVGASVSHPILDCPAVPRFPSSLPPPDPCGRVLAPFPYFP